MPSDVLVPLIDQLHAEGITKTRAYALVAEQNFMRPETVRRLYLAQRETFQNKSHASTEVNDNGPWGPDVSNWVRGVEKAKKCTQSEAAREVCEVLGWTMDDYIHHTVGKWHWDATIRNPRRREKGDWVRVTDEAPTKKWPDTESSD